MSMVPVYVGLDYHQRSIQVCAVDEAGRPRVNRKCDNDVLAVTEAVRGLGPVRGVAIEACTGAADLGDQLVASLGWRVELAHSTYVAKLKQSPDKTDFSDARLLADLTRVGYLPRVWLAPRCVRLLRQLVRHRQRLVDRRRAVKLQVGALMREQRLAPPDALSKSRWSLAWQQAVQEALPWPSELRFIIDDLFDDLASLGKRIKSTERALDEATQDDAVTRRLRTLQGVGPVTAWTLAASVGDFGRFANGKQLARYCGLSPRNASSGQRSADAGLIRAADPALRATLIQAGHRLARSEGRFGELAQRLRDRGKPYNVAVAAVTNRWVRWLYHRMKPVGGEVGGE